MEDAKRAELIEQQRVKTLEKKIEFLNQFKAEFDRYKQAGQGQWQPGKGFVWKDARF